MSVEDSAVHSRGADSACESCVSRVVAVELKGLLGLK